MKIICNFTKMNVKDSMDEKKRLLPSRQDYDNVNEMPQDLDEEWSDDSCSGSDYTSDTDSSIPEWESSVNEYTGEVLYIDCHPFVTQSYSEKRDEKTNQEPFTYNNNTRRSTRGKFLRLLRRRDSKRRSRRHNPKQDSDPTTSSKVKFQDFQEGEEKDVTLTVESGQVYNLGRKASTIECLLGIIVSTLSDGERLMIAGFSPDSKAKNERNIKIGDWLKSINNKEITNSNLNEVLSEISNCSEVLLKLQRVAGVEVTKEPPVHELNHQSNFVKEMILLNNADVSSTLCHCPLGIVYIDPKNLSESSPEYDDVIFCFPQPVQKNILCTARGMFTTLNHLLNRTTKQRPLISSVLYKDRLTHVAYIFINEKLLLHMLPGNCVSVQEMVLISQEIVHLLEFKYSSIDEAFKNEKSIHEIDQFFARYFIRLLNGFQWTTTQKFLDSSCSAIKTNQKQNNAQFENVLPAVPTVNLPEEAQMQIDDALTDLEASDYREWNEEPLDCQRLFTILGSALYHAGYLLASHLMYEDLLDVHLYCKHEGLHHLSSTEPLKSLVIWREVFPSSCSRLFSSDERRYLLIVGSGKNLLATIMEAGGCTEPPEENMGPDAFYVEEAQATLEHLQELGVFELADKLLHMYIGNQTTLPGLHNNRRRGDFMGNIGFLKGNSASNSRDNLKKPEVTSILKRRGSDQGLTTHSSSLHLSSEDNYDMYSEDSVSQSGYSGQSDFSDESGLEKRLGKDKKNRYGSDEDLELEECEDCSQMSNSCFDVSDLKEPLLNEITDIQPSKITSGDENVLFYYIHLDATEKILIYPPTDELPSALDNILDTFRDCCQKIHALFDNTIRFRKMSSQDMAKSVINKSLIAIKEHGVLFEHPCPDEKETKKQKVTFWVVGRLFHMPHPREVYVCYQDSIPQNLIELAFKISLNRNI